MSDSPHVQPSMGPLFTALVAAQREVKAVAKDGTNPFHHYKYATSEDVLAEGRSALLNHGLALTAVGYEIEAPTVQTPHELYDKDGKRSVVPL